MENGPDLHMLYRIVPASNQSHQCHVEPLEEQQRIYGNNRTISLSIDQLLRNALNNTHYLLEVAYANTLRRNETLVTKYPIQTASVGECCVGLYHHHNASI